MLSGWPVRLHQVCTFRTTAREAIEGLRVGTLLAADQQPFGFQDNSKSGVDFQLSGHTHAGQLFPLRLVYTIQIYSYGEYKYD